MKKLNMLLNRLEKQKPLLEKLYKVKNIGIFGSYSKGQQNVQSDLDILVEFSKPIGLLDYLSLEEN
jgi:predicted nucleotidyltransferase